MATPGRTRLKGEERRQLILEAARRVFLETGFAGARTRRIAEEAGITEALLYRFFPSKLAIYEAAVLQPLEAFAAMLGVHMGLAIDGLLRDIPSDEAGVARQLTALFSDGMSEEAQHSPVSFPAQPGASGVSPGRRRAPLGKPTRAAAS